MDRSPLPWTLFFLFSVVAGSPVFAASDPLHPLEDIYHDVRAFLHGDSGSESGMTIEVVPLDPRLQLRHCSQPLSLHHQGGRRQSGKVVVGVRCKGEVPWRIYVSAKLRVVREVVVAASPILKGERVRAGDLLLEPHDLSTLRRGYFESPESVVGRHARQTIQQAAVLNPKLLYVPDLVSRGDRVLIVVELGGVRVSMKGVAMDGGQRGEWIEVRNSSSGKVVEGVVVDAGIVHVATGTPVR